MQERIPTTIPNELRNDTLDMHSKKRKKKKTIILFFSYCHCKETHTYVLPL